MTPSTYLEVLDANLNLDSDAWFDDSGEDIPDDFQYSGDAAIALIEQGETLWDCPGWVADIAREFTILLFDGNLIKLRLMAKWLIPTVPEDFLDSQLAGKLRYIADGDFCTAFEGKNSAWPRSSEYYRQNLKLEMARVALEQERSLSRASGLG